MCVVYFKQLVIETFHFTKTQHQHSIFIKLVKLNNQGKQLLGHMNAIEIMSLKTTAIVSDKRRKEMTDPLEIIQYNKSLQSITQVNSFCILCV